MSTTTFAELFNSPAIVADRSNFQRTLLLYIIGQLFAKPANMDNVLATSQLAQYKALATAGITDFDDLISTREDDIRALEYVVTDTSTGEMNVKKLPIGHTNLLVAFIAYFHEKSFKLQEKYNPIPFELIEFNDWRTTSYKPNSSITPWRIRLTETQEQAQLFHYPMENSNEAAA